MKNFSQLTINLLLIHLFFLVLSSCEMFAKEKIIQVNDENKAWINKGSVGDYFIMTDNAGISQSFTMRSNNHEFTEGSSGFLFFTTEVSLREYYYQHFNSTFGNNFSLSLSANYSPFGDELFISVDGIGFAWDLKFNTIARIDSPFGYKSKILTNKGYVENEPIMSSVEILDMLAVNGVSYEGVLHFRLLDFADQWHDFTLTEMYIAKEFGLIRYVRHNGLVSERAAPGIMKNQAIFFGNQGGFQSSFSISGML